MGRIKALFPSQHRNDPPLAKMYRYRLPGRIKGSQATDSCTREFEELMECYTSSAFDERKCYSQQIAMEKCMSEFMLLRKKRTSVRFHGTDMITRRLPWQ